MKIALPSREGHIDDHFGHCDYFTVYTVDMENKSILNSQLVESPSDCGCKSDIATTLSDLGVKIMLAGNMGSGAVTKLKTSGIEVIRGCSGNIETVANEWLQGNIQDSTLTCVAHECNH